MSKELSQDMKNRILSQLMIRDIPRDWSEDKKGEVTGSEINITNKENVYGSVLPGLSGSAINIRGLISNKYGVIDLDLRADVSVFMGDLTGIKGDTKQILEVFNEENSPNK
jgi:hypothetical protein